MNDLIVETRTLTKRFGVQTAVDRVSLKVPHGKIYGLLGRNGAGKTTVIRMLTGLAAPTGGEVRLFGTDPAASRRETYRRVGTMIESPGFYENLTGRENLRLLARLRGEQKPDSVEAALRTVGLEKEYKKPFRNYSLGMKQRLGIAAAVMHDPELLILDEPVNGLDPIGIAEVRSYLEALCRERGVTILLSSHILSEIEQLADIIGVMHEGRLLEETKMEELHRRNRQYVEFAVSDPNKASLILEERFHITDYTAEEAGRLRLYAAFDKRAALNRAFVEAGISVSGIRVSEDKLEDYFSALIGGGIIG